jgi:hypothetical protein
MSSKGENMTKEEALPVELEVICSDFDEDCEEVENKVNCWLYQPECGLCPFLNPNKENK